MSLGFGDSPGGTKLAKKSKWANQYLQNAIDPSLFSTDSKYLSDGYKAAVNSGVNFGGYYQGAPGVGTFDSAGNYYEPGNNPNLPTILPGYEAMANYNTLLGNYDQGNLSASQNALLGSGMGILTGDTANSGGYFNDMLNSGLIGGGAMGGGGGVPSPPDFANRELNVDNIGALVGDIFDDMPEPFQKFTLDMLNTSDPAYVEQQVADFSQQINEFVNMQVADSSRAALDVFSSQGLGSSGAAIAGMVDIATRATVEASARVSEYALTRYDQAIKQQGIAEQLVQDYLSAGATEQANRVQYEAAKLQAEASAYGSYAAAQASVQSSLIAASTSIQNNLISAAAGLEGQRLGFLDSQMNNLYSENALVNQQNTTALMLPYQSMYNMQGLQTSKGADSGFQLGGLGELATGLGTLIPVLSDVRVKENIKPLGVKYHGYPLYMFNYKWSKTPMISVMAQDVEQVNPDAVVEINGIKAVKLWEI